MGDHKGITVVLGVGDDRHHPRLRSALDDAVTVVDDQPALRGALTGVEVRVPDVVVLDDHESREATIEACWRVVTQHPATRCVVMASADDEVSYETLVNGAFSVLRTDASSSTVIDAVVSASRSESMVLAGVARMLLADTKLVLAENRDPFARLVRLTDTEKEVLTRLAGGLSAAEIAALHGVTARLVNLHTGYAVAKLHHHVQRVRVRDSLEPINA